MKSYNVRVYGILINESNEVLLSKEIRNGFSFTKFPGGGHRLGEGLLDCLKRELREEIGIEIRIIRHFYTIDYFQPSGFDDSQQLISVYYLIASEEMGKIVDGQDALDIEEGNEHQFYWKSLDKLNDNELTFPVDKLILKQLTTGSP